jgi:dihydrofolate reductase
MSEKTPRISLIWAQDENGLIGKAGRLPWRLPADMAWFRRQTMGKPILMGRKTFESIGKPLPGRRNLVLSRQDMAIEGCTVVHGLDDARTAAFDAEEIMVIGGAEIYALALPEAERMYVTRIHHGFEGDVYFPPFEKGQWEEVLREDHGPDEKNPYAYSFIIFERHE